MENERDLRTFALVQRGKEVLEELDARKEGKKMLHRDGYVNMVTRYGTAKDSSEQFEFMAEGATLDSKLCAAYEGDGLFAKIIDVPAEEAVKHGFDIGVNDEDVTKYLQDKSDELDVEGNLATALKWSRLFGGSIIVMMVDDGKGLDEPLNFAQLLEEVEKIEGLERIRFMTSHPKDLSDELIEVMAKSKKICRHLHLPLQSGSSRILKAMNRRYTKEQYLALAEKIKTAIPDISLTTDIIVGFPGETEEDFQETLDVVRKVRFDSAFTFIYSKRTGTPAAAMENQVPEDVVKNRFDRLLKEVQDISAEVCGRDVHTVQTVLVEEVNDHSPELVTGRMSNNIVVHFPGDASLIGKLVDVYLEESKGFYYMGRLNQ